MDFFAIASILMVNSLPGFWSIDLAYRSGIGNGNFKKNRHRKIYGNHYCW